MKEVLRNSLLASTLALTASCEKPKDQIDHSRTQAKVILKNPCNQESPSSEFESRGNLPPERIEISEFGQDRLKKLAQIRDEYGNEMTRLERIPVNKKQLPEFLYDQFKIHLSDESVSMRKEYQNKETGKETVVNFNLLSNNRINVDGGDWSFVLSPYDNLSRVPDAAMAVLPVEKCVVYFRNSKTGGEYYFDSGAFNGPCPRQDILETLTSIRIESK